MRAFYLALLLAPGAFAQGRIAEQSKATKGGGATIPLSTYSISPTKVKEKRALTGTIVGGNPFATPPTGATIDAVLVPVIVNIGSRTFDPTAPNSCDFGISAVSRFNSSPLVQPSPLTFNGVNVGNAQYVDGFMRAEFWSLTGGNPAYSNPIRFSTAAAITITAGAQGTTTGSGCSLLGAVSGSFLNTQIESWIQTLTASGVLSTSKVAIFLMNNIGNEASVPLGYPLGFHDAIGSPPQLYVVADYDATPTFGTPGIAVAAHEIAELMNDPFVSNATPAWGSVGEATGCQANLEVADPLTGTGAKMIVTLSGFDYHMPEFAYFSWFFNAHGTPSLGAGGLFSSNGTFKGPSRDCPPGGTF